MGFSSAGYAAIVQIYVGLMYVFKFMSMCCLVAFWGVILTLGHFNLSWSPLENGGQLAAVQYEMDGEAAQTMMTQVGQAAQTAMQATGQWLQHSGVVEATIAQGSHVLSELTAHHLSEGIAAAVPTVDAGIPEASNAMLGSMPTPPMPEDALLG